jgi:hypothetical protein
MQDWGGEGHAFPAGLPGTASALWVGKLYTLHIAGLLVTTRTGDIRELIYSEVETVCKLL